MKNHKIKLILVISASLLIVFNVLSFYVTDQNIETTVEEAIANQTLETAKAVSAKFDIATYKRFLSNPEKNDDYWKINYQLNTIKEDIGALFVYTLKVDNPKVSHTMIAGIPRNEQDFFQIGSVCTLPEEEVSHAFYNGAPYTSEIIDDPLFGKYLSKH